MPIASIHQLFQSTKSECSPIYNERSLQLELGILFRSKGYRVEFECPMVVHPLSGSTKRPKRNLDILVHADSSRIALELKVPLAGRIPETMYDFCADIEFVESIARSGAATYGLCLLMTSDSLFWSEAPVSNKIYDLFRVPGKQLSGIVQKPTGMQDTTLRLSGSYDAHGAWRELANASLMKAARYLLVEIKKPAGDLSRGGFA